MTKDFRYIVASQDRALQGSLRKVSGRCLLYLHKAAPVLETPSDASKKCVSKKANNLLSQETEKKIDFLKQKEGLVKHIGDQLNRKNKRPKNPNLLPCKKSKKKPQPEQQKINKTKNQYGSDKDHNIADKSKPDMKPNPVYVKEVLNNKS